MNETMKNILDAREARRDLQQKLLNQYKTTLVCFTMNIPGEEKDTPLVRLAFREGMLKLRETLPETLHEELRITADGPEGYFVVAADAGEIKKLTTRLEEEAPVGRLFDMDVLTAEGEKISRETERPCIVCGGSVYACIRSKAHTVAQCTEKAERILADFAAETLAKTAVECLLEEARLTPKPGLVDGENSGAHTDMDLPLFEKSANALLPYFRKAVLLGMEEEYCMDRLQPAGVEAEETMLKVTGGVNTHKGAIYAFGLILSAIGSHLSFGSEIFSTASVLALDGKLPDNTHGSEVRMKFRRCGARYEATEGFPNAISAYNILCETSNPYRALLWLIASVPDTNLLYRGGIDGLVFAQEMAKKTQALDDAHLLDGIREMDKKLTEHRLSPGGSADLLSLGMFLQKTEEIWDEGE